MTRTRLEHVRESVLVSYTVYIALLLWCMYCFGPNSGTWILFGCNFNFAVILRFGWILITRQIAQISKSTKANKMHGIELFESPNLNIMAKLKLYPFKIHIVELGLQAVDNLHYSLASGQLVFLGMTWYQTRTTGKASLSTPSLSLMWSMLCWFETRATRRLPVALSLTPGYYVIWD